jgi:hypothetical protein
MSKDRHSLIHTRPPHRGRMATHLEPKYIKQSYTPIHMLLHVHCCMVMARLSIPSNDQARSCSKPSSFDWVIGLPHMASAWLAHIVKRVTILCCRECVPHCPLRVSG